jgi:hypothetical protein
VRQGAALLVFLALACTQSGPASGQVQQSPKTTVHTFAGGCAGTVLTDAQPPQWAQGGWTRGNGPWPVPWAFGTHGDAIAYLFAGRLVAGGSPRADGSNNKVLWEVKDSPSGANVMVEGRPLGEYQPVVTIAGGPSITDVPTAGCWTFRLVWASSGYAHSSIINLEALPAGTLPPY